ncbi:MAG: CHAT domain-containing protein [candidate division Zixibacteria bacterium]|nr:CHAT domain-containing protein [candidate division Zixibacteria bacterium]
MNHKLIVIVLLFLIAPPISSSGRDFREMMNYADSLSDSLYQDSAIATGKLALDMAIAEVGPEDTAVARIMQRMGDFHFFKQEYREVESYYKRSLTIREKAIGPDHSKTAESMGNLAVLYRRLGRYAEAEPLYRKAIEIWERVYGADDDNVALGWNNMAALCYSQGRYADAAEFFRKARGIFERTFGADHHYVAMANSNLGVLFRDQGRYAEAEPLLISTLADFTRIHGPDHTWTAHAMNDLALLFHQQRRFDEAEPLYQRALAISENRFGSEHPILARHLFHLANLYSDLGQYDQAESLYLRALKLKKIAYDSSSIQVARIEQHYSRLLRRQCDSTRSLTMARRCAHIMQQGFTNNASALSETNALTFSEYCRNAMDDFVSTFIDFGADDSGSIESAVSIILAGKGRVSDQLFERRRALAIETDSLTLALAEDFRTARFRLSQLYVNGPGVDAEGYRRNAESITAMANELEIRLLDHSQSFQHQQSNRNITAKRLTDRLPHNSVLIEYLKYDYLPPEDDAAIPHYLAVVLSRDTEPAVVEMGEAGSIDSIVACYRQHMQRVAETGLPSETDREEYFIIANALYQAIWLPVAKHLKDKMLVLVAPDGNLNLISFAALPHPSGYYLAEKQAIHYLSSGRDIIRMESTPPSGSGLFALGDPDFDAPAVNRASVMPSVDTSATVDQTEFTLRGSSNNIYRLHEKNVSPLPQTRREVKRIAKNWRANLTEPATVCLGSQASEERFKADAPGNRVIHLATHGFFVNSNDDSNKQQRNPGTETDFLSENPLLQSGLFLAGANLRGQGSVTLGTEDGVLTAHEVTSMNLSGTDLVVLSACESALGEVQTGEGVYGLRRSFQMAGARTVVSSLWSVPDKQTAQVMEELYKLLDRQTGLSLATQMQQLSIERLKDLRRKSLPDHPFLWAAFIVTGDWR